MGFGEHALSLEGTHILSAKYDEITIGRTKQTIKTQWVAHDDEHNVAIHAISLEGQGCGFENGVVYAKLEDLPEVRKFSDYISSYYKIIVGSVLKSNKKTDVFYRMNKIGQMETCDNSYQITYLGETEEERDNAFKYLNTDFVKFILSRFVRDGKCGCTIEFLNSIPDQDFKNNSGINGIDWSQSIRDIDIQLFQKYGLTLEQSNYIINELIDDGDKQFLQIAAADYYNKQFN